MMCDRTLACTERERDTDTHPPTHPETHTESERPHTSELPHLKRGNYIIHLNVNILEF